MGRGKLKGKDTPHTVVLTRPFCMDETEVTTGAYAKCIEAGKCEEPYKWDPWASYPRFPDHPVNLVSQTKATAYCAWVGKELPTEAQWEWAATGGEAVEWPWGNEEPTCENGLADFTPFGAPKSAPGGDVGCGGGGPSPVKAHPRGAKAWPSGKIYDLAGNVWEWTRDFAMPYPREKQVDPVVLEVPGKPDMTVRSIRGGGWNRSSTGCTVWFRGEATERYQVPGLGFRCVRNPGEPAAK
jgi:formylglycine-generating enzyme required for sulfatase activity